MPVESLGRGRREGVGGPFSEFNSFDRDHPHLLRVEDYLRLLAMTSPERVRRVPTAAIVGEDEESSCVACPCAAHPIVTSSLRRCPRCERWFMRVDLGVVLVAYGDMAPPPLR